MRYLFKLFKQGAALFIIGPLVGWYTFLSKHWFLNSSIGLVSTVGLLALSTLSLNPILAFGIAYVASAAGIGLIQQVFAFLNNSSLGQCEMMCAPIVPEISYSMMKGMLAANEMAVKAECEYQNKPAHNGTIDDAFYGKNSLAFLLYTGGHSRCAQKGCVPVTWIQKEEQSRSFSI